MTIYKSTFSKQIFNWFGFKPPPDLLEVSPAISKIHIPIKENIFEQTREPLEKRLHDTTTKL